MCGWVWESAHEDVSKWPELDPQDCHRRVMGQCGQSNNCLLSLSLLLHSLKGSESIVLNLTPHILSCPSHLFL